MGEVERQGGNKRMGPTDLPPKGSCPDPLPPGPYLGTEFLSPPVSSFPMDLRLERTGTDIQFTGTNGAYDLQIASSDDQEGISPMEMAALSTLGCSSIDILLILEKQQQDVDRFHAEVDAERAEEPPRVFTDLHMHYVLEGDVAPSKVRRAVDLSLETYCSVSNMIDETATITYAFTVNGERYEQDA